MRLFLVSCCLLLFGACAGSRVRPSYTPPEPPTPEPEIILPSEEACPGWFEASSEKTGPWLGRDLARGQVHLNPGERIVFRARDTFEDKHFDALVGIPGLNALMFWNQVRITAAGLSRLPEDSGIEYVGLVGPCCSGEALEVIGRWKDVRGLYLHEMSIYLKDDHLSSLQSLPLEDLAVSQCWGLDGSFLRYMPPTLTDLQIFQHPSGVNEDELVRMKPDMLALLPDLPYLETVALDDIEFGGVPDLSPLDRQKALYGFRMQGCDPSPDWSAGGGRVFQRMNLKLLDLTWGGLDDEGLRAVTAGLKLEALDVSSNKVGESLATLVEMESLKRLAFMGTLCDDTTFLKLAELPNLESIWIPTRISQDAIDRFKELRPEVSIATAYED